MVNVRRILLLVAVLATLGLASPLYAIPKCTQCGCACGTPCLDATNHVSHCIRGCVDPACTGSALAAGETLSEEAFLASLSEPEVPCETPSEPLAAR